MIDISMAYAKASTRWPTVLVWVHFSISIKTNKSDDECTQIMVI